MAPKEDSAPILFVDVDGVLSLFGFPHDREPPGRFHMVDGMTHCLGHGAGARLQALSERFELVWATGWEERANEHLPYLLQLPFRDLPTLSFDGRAVFGSAHWKIAAIDRYARDRPAAWIDDFLDEECRTWARRRRAPTLLVQTESAIGLSDEHVQQLLDWADEVTARAKAEPA
jgi:HAD domain in Swiss Army Knife RNA repair proteins